MALLLTYSSGAAQLPRACYALHSWAVTAVVVVLVMRWCNGGVAGAVLVLMVQFWC